MLVVLIVLVLVRPCQCNDAHPSKQSLIFHSLMYGNV
jgi:hypothetical protein